MINLSDYFELAVTGTELIVATTTPKVCAAEGTLLKLLSVGDCSFTVSTPRTKDYLAKASTNHRLLLMPANLLFCLWKNL